MAQSTQKGKCSDCRVCRAYLRESDRNQTRKEEALIPGEQADAPDTAESVDNDRLQTGAENPGCPVPRSFE